MIENDEYIYYTINELCNAEEDFGWVDKDDTCVKIIYHDIYRLTDAGCDCCSNTTNFSKQSLIELIDYSIKQLQKRVEELKND
jgi:hypothetical protein